MYISLYTPTNHAEFVLHGFAVTHEYAHSDDAQQFVVTWSKPRSWQ